MRVVKLVAVMVSLCTMAMMTRFGESVAVNVVRCGTINQFACRNN